MPKPKVTLTLIACNITVNKPGRLDTVPGYRVKAVENTTEFRPGDNLTTTVVDQQIDAGTKVRVISK